MAALARGALSAGSKIYRAIVNNGDSIGKAYMGGLTVAGVVTSELQKARQENKNMYNPYKDLDQDPFASVNNMPIKEKSSIEIDRGSRRMIPDESNLSSYQAPIKESNGGKLDSTETEAGGVLNYNPYLSTEMNNNSPTMLHRRSVVNRDFRRRVRRNKKKYRARIFVC